MNYYKEALNILTSDKELNYKKIVHEFAMQYPKRFVDIVNPQRDVFQVLRKEQWHNDVRSFIMNNQKVEAIKKVRIETGLGLREAKDVCDLAEEIIEPFWSPSGRQSLMNRLDIGHEDLAKLMAA